ncbi:MAG: hypothetical protein JO350_11035 [Candidatus Eremiobacteraeota bacterium]|nr:hypothetical protein [Candidatus Eremiobacteraeota bacterium]
MTAESRVPLEGTHRIAWPGATPVGEAGEGDVLLTAWLRPRRGGELDVARATALGSTVPSQRAYTSRADLRRATACDPDDVLRLQKYCGTFGIEIVETRWRSVILSGPIENSIAAFGATAAIYQLDDRRRFRHRSGSLHLPSDIATLVRAVFGIHQWPRSHAVGALHPKTAPLSMSDVVSRYAFPDSDGSGQTIAVLQFRGSFRSGDFSTSLRVQGITTQPPIVKRVDNAELAHDTDTMKDVESAIDTQIAAALAPGSQIVVYAAPDDERGTLDAIREALFDEEHSASVLSISFGFPEYLWTPIALTILNELFTVAALLGVSVFCASGDNGAETDYDGQPHVLAPASSPFAMACGGTQINAGDAGEMAWDRTGGGFSDRFGVPAWQSSVNPVAAGYAVKPGRGVPDVAAQAMPGYPIVFEGTQLAAGGTSAVAPVWSALAARLNARLGAKIGFFAPLLYRAPGGTCFRDVTSGSNGKFSSGAGWNACTGLGVPIGSAIETALR